VKAANIQSVTSIRLH